jgi:putative ABC transport system permease protein
MEIAPARSANIDSPGGILDTLAFTPHKRSKQGFMLLAEKDKNYWQSILNDDAILVSEPLAYRLQLKVGDKLQLFTDTAGFIPFEVVGIYRDYGSSHGRLAMRLSLYQKFWVDRNVSSVAINLGNSSVQAAIDELRSLAASAKQQLMIRSNRSIKERSLVVFDQTFQVTRVLRLLTIGVAFIGILSALLALQLERTRELATLRALGLTPNQSAGLIFGQSLSLGVISGVLAIPLGLMMGDILIDVINLRSFGWTMAQDLRSSTVIETVIIATAAAAIAALYPVWKQYSLPVIRELHSE